MSETDAIINQLRDKIAGFRDTAKVEKVGAVLELGDGVARLSGLSEVGSMEMLDFGHGVFGVALNLAEDSVGAMFLGDYTQISVGDIVRTTGRILSVPVGDGLIGRVVNALGQPIDGKGEISAKGGSASGGKSSIQFYPVEKI